jgi:DnaK suppressor protein
MFVSLLQLMGFSTVKPVHSRAEENALSSAPRPEAAAAHGLPVATQASKIQEKPARRSTVKAPAVKSKTTAAKVDAVAKPAKASKAVAVAKPVAKPPGAKASAKVLEAAPVPKAVKPVKPAKLATPPEPPKVTKPVPPISKKKPEEVTTKIQAESAAKAAKSATPPVVAATPQLTPLGVPVRSGRPSSRLAQLTVPSMAQSVASTAAKASFTQMTTPQPIVPPLASSVKKDPKLANN